jgi:hypothetical protein
MHDAHCEVLSSGFSDHSHKTQLTSPISSNTKSSPMKATPSMTGKKTPLQNLVKNPNAIDVLMGRGGQSNNHPGNKHYQSVLEAHAWEYSQLKGRDAKTKFAWGIFQRLKKECIRFLKCDRAKGVYLEAEDDEARKKISQRLRELALEVREHASDDGSSEEIVLKPTAIKDSPISMSSGRPASIAHVNPFTVDIEESELLNSCLSEDEEPAKEGRPPSNNHPNDVLNSRERDLNGLDDDSPPLSWEEISSEQAVCGSLGDLSACDLSTSSIDSSMSASFGVSIDLPDDFDFDGDAGNQALHGAGNQALRGAVANQHFSDCASWQDPQHHIRASSGSSQRFQEFARYRGWQAVASIPQYQEAATSNQPFWGFRNYPYLQGVSRIQVPQGNASVQHQQLQQFNQHTLPFLQLNQDRHCFAGPSMGRNRSHSFPGPQDFGWDVTRFQHMQGLRQIFRGNAINQPLQPLSQDVSFVGSGVVTYRSHSLPGPQDFRPVVARRQGLRGVTSRQVSQGNASNQHLRQLNQNLHSFGGPMNGVGSVPDQQDCKQEEPAVKRKRQSSD